MATVKLEGMYFNKTDGNFSDDPETSMTVSKEVLDRSSRMFLGRFDFNIESRTKLIFTVEIDGIKVDDYGTNLPYQEASGKYTTVLFKYPNSAKANKRGNHKVKVTYGLIEGIVESEEGRVVWDEVTTRDEVTFSIKLV